MTTEKRDLSGGTENNSPGPIPADKNHPQHFSMDYSSILLDNILENTKMLGFCIDKNYNFVMANSGYISAMKSAYNVDIIVGSNLIQTFKPAEHAITGSTCAMLNIKQALQGQTLVLKEHIRFSPQSLNYFETTYCPIKDSNGEITGAAVYSRNITEIEEATRALTESESRYRMLADNVSDIIVTTDLNPNLTYVSPSIITLLGYTPNECIDKPLYEFVTAESYELVLNFIRQELAKGKPGTPPLYPVMEIEAICKDGAALWMEIKATWLKDSNGNPAGTIGILRDIGGRRQVEIERNRQLNFLRQVIDCNPNYIFVKDTENRYLLVNRRLANAYGTSPAEIEGKTDSELDILPPDYIKFRLGDLDVFETCMGSFSTEDSITLPSGETRYCQTAKMPLPDENGILNKVLITAVDITERKQLEQKVMELATHDYLTGLPNRTLLNDRLQVALVQAKRKAKKMAIMVLDIDNFKAVNDTLGHSAGDELLQALTHRLLETIRKSDTFARFGGDEFFILLSEINCKEEATDMARRMIELFEQPFLLSKSSIRISVSIGIAIYPDHGKEMEDLIQHADAAMYQAKEHGGNRFCLYNGCEASKTLPLNSHSPSNCRRAE